MVVKKSGKMKVSKVKHSNQVITKLKKQGKIKSQRHRKKKIINRQPQKPEKRDNQAHSDNESLQGDDMLDMLGEDDLDYLMQTAAAKQKEGKKRKAIVQENEEELENEYESTIIVPDQKRKKQLLPIKTKDGFQMRSMDIEASNKQESPDQSEEEEDGDFLEEKGSDEEIFEEDTVMDTVQPISATELFLAMHKDLENKKIKIGVLASGILENPELKMNNFFTLFYLMDEKTKTGSENLLTIRKLATVSVLEVFKDILPDYQISQQDFGEVKLKKDTFALNKYEGTLLAHYKRYLQRLEKMASLLIKKKGDTRKIDESKTKLANIAITCLCDLLVTHPYFNYSSNLAQMLVPFLNNRNPSIRHIVNECFKTVFKNDKKGVASLTLVRKINHLVKTRSNDVNCEVLNCLLALRIKDVNLEDEKKLEMKQKKQMSHKQRLLSMSKKERKRNKKLKELEKEMLETKAEESKQTKQQNLTEITKVVFMIYFRILKRSPNSKLLSATLEGLSKFAHIMNIDYFSDLVNLLNSLLEEEDLGYRERLHCVETVFAVLSGQGDVLNIDPTRFYTHLYRDLLTINAGKNHPDLIIIIRALTSVLIKRRKKISQQVLLAFLKRVATLSLQVSHHGALSCLGVLKTVIQQSKQSEILLDLDEELGSGRYDPFLMEPEYCNASTTALYELAILRHHYHPTVRTVANNIVNGLPATGEGSLPAEIGKLSPEQLFDSYDGSKMAFKPAIPVPKKVQPKSRPGRHTYMHPNFEDYCKTIANVQTPGPFDFSEIFKNNKKE